MDRLMQDPRFTGTTFVVIDFEDSPRPAGPPSRSRSRPSPCAPTAADWSRSDGSSP
ncbi:hypothetical protein [Kitasatospora paranensis]|uniref:hypothetical protein n=1 Tax=Kitasatospora paranensis TaxID=258053 RepID=UPI0031E7F93D